MDWLWEIYFYTSVLQMELSFRSSGEGKGDCSRLFQEAGKKKFQENLITGLLLGGFQLVGLVKEIWWQKYNP